MQFNDAYNKVIVNKCQCFRISNIGFNDANIFFITVKDASVIVLIFLVVIKLKSLM